MPDDVRHPSRPDLYETDFHAWAEAQAALIQALGEAGRLPPELDWARLAEEMGDLGKSELRGAESLVRAIIVHLTLIEASRSEEPVRHWRAEVAAFQQDLAGYLTPTIRAKLQAKLDQLHAEALKLAALKLAAHEPATPPPSPARRWTMPEILGAPGAPT